MSDDNAKAALSEELNKADPDVNRLLDLAHEIANLDQRTVRFSTDAGLVARLGRELVARPETALSELVKNGYDADATVVTVDIARPAEGDFIEISDDGVGMTREELVSGFMRLATVDKIANPYSKKFGRRRAGRKGVGRLAAERLGKTLMLTTSVEGADHALRVYIDWRKFTPGVDLRSISFPVFETTKTGQHGTTLRIEGLRDSWPPSALERTFEHVAELIEPIDGAGVDPSPFEVSFSDAGASKKIVDLRTQIEKHAYAIVHCDIDGQGAATFAIDCPPLQISIKDRKLVLDEDRGNKLASARNVHMTARYYILDSSLFPPTAFRTVQRYLNANGGIRVYRNGFRVSPYGQRGDDWLGLDLLSARRTGTLAPVRNRNFLGSVRLDDAEGLFEETSSREGLLESTAFEELVETLHSALVTAVREIDGERTRRALKREKPSVDPERPAKSEKKDTSEEAARDLATAVDDARSKVDANNPQGAALQVALDKISDTAKEVVQAAARENVARLKEIDLLRVLASMGLAIGQFTHEFSTLSGAMASSLTVLTEEGRSKNEREDAGAAFKTLLDQARSFTGLYKGMTEGNALRDRDPIDLYEASTSFRSAVSAVLARNAVTMDIDDSFGDVTSPPMHRSELFAVLLNLTTNSIKAIKRAGHAGTILLELTQTAEGDAQIRFNDDGDGIDPEIRDRMFEPFVTTTAAKGIYADDDEMAVGSGLGLAIVHDIVTGAGGSVGVEDPREGYSTCIVVNLVDRKGA